MNDAEIRLRCIEAAAKTPMVHVDGPAAGVLGVADAWVGWITSGARAASADAEPYWQDMVAERVAARPVLGVPKK